jgi:hypothetical protein
MVRAPFVTETLAGGLWFPISAGAYHLKQWRTTINAETAELAENFILCVFCEFCVDRAIGHHDQGGT